MNLKSELVWAERSGSGWEPVSAEACYPVSDLVAAMSEGSSEGACSRRSGLKVFVQYWNNTTDEGRRVLLSGVPPLSLGSDELAVVAAVVHGLCVKDGIAPPDWVLGKKASVDLCLFGTPLDSAMGVRVRQEADVVCEEHGVFFSRDFLEKV